MERINGVNLGNWLVLERWMNPAMFRPSGQADEIWMHRVSEPEKLRAELKAHRDSYVTANDFHAIADHDYNLVRIPVPYFIFGGCPGHPGCIEYLDKAFSWANETGLKVLIDLHTVPGSQNGFDNGGLTGVCRWHRSPRQIKFVLDVLTRLAGRYRDNPALYGIEVLNEPVSWFVWHASPSTRQAKNPDEARGSGYVPMRFLKRFYAESYRRLRVVLKPKTVIVFHDGFRLNRWGDWFVRQGMRNVVLDTHIYLNSLGKGLPFGDLMLYRLYLSIASLRIRLAARHIPVLVGEWCLSNELANKVARRAGDTRAVNDTIKVYRKVLSLEQKAFSPAIGKIYWNYQLGKRYDGCLPAGVSPEFAEPADLNSWSLVDMWQTVGDNVPI